MIFGRISEWDSWLWITVLLLSAVHLGEIAISDGPLLVMLTWKTQLWEALIASLYDERSLVVGAVLRALLPVWWLLFLRVEWGHFLSLGTLFKFWYLLSLFNNTFFTFRLEIHSGGNTFSMFHIMKCHITCKIRIGIVYSRAGFFWSWKFYLGERTKMIFQVIFTHIAHDFYPLMIYFCGNSKHLYPKIEHYKLSDSKSRSKMNLCF